MKATIGDHITVHGQHVGDASRFGEVIEVLGPDGEPPYVMRWEDGHSAIFVPGSGALVDHAPTTEGGSGLSPAP
jgi:Domain of unknown function (DUF1918)